MDWSIQFSKHPNQICSTSSNSDSSAHKYTLTQNSKLYLLQSQLNHPFLTVNKIDIDFRSAVTRNMMSALKPEYLKNWNPKHTLLASFLSKQTTLQKRSFSAAPTYTPIPAALCKLINFKNNSGQPKLLSTTSDKNSWNLALVNFQNEICHAWRPQRRQIL